MQAQTKALEQAGIPVRSDINDVLVTWVSREENPRFFVRLNSQAPGVVAIDLYSEKTRQEIDDYQKERADALEKAKSSSNPEYYEELKKRVDRDTGAERTIVRGDVNPTGGIWSFYQAYNRKNLLALLFELPENPVRLNNFWAVDAHFMTRQKYVCDSASSQNKVTLTAIRQEKRDRVAVIKYEVSEYLSGAALGIPAKTTYSYRAVGEFSLTTGRWLKYDGVLASTIIGKGLSEGPLRCADAKILFSFRPQ